MTRLDPQYSTLLVNYTANEAQRLKSQISLEGQDDGSVRLHLWMEAGWKALFGLGWEKPPNGARVWETSTYTITFPDGSQTEGVFPGASGSQTVDSYGESQPYMAGTWRVYGNYGVQMKDVLGRWGSNIGVTPTVEFTVPAAEPVLNLPTRAHIVPGHVQKVFNVSGAGTDNGAALDLWDWADVDQQKYTVTAVDGGYYKIIAKHTAIKPSPSPAARPPTAPRSTSGTGPASTTRDSSSAPSPTKPGRRPAVAPVRRRGSRPSAQEGPEIATSAQRNLFGQVRNATGIE